MITHEGEEALNDNKQHFMSFVERHAVNEVVYPDGLVRNGYWKILAFDQVVPIDCAYFYILGPGEHGSEMSYTISLKMGVDELYAIQLEGDVFEHSPNDDVFEELDNGENIAMGIVAKLERLEEEGKLHYVSDK